MVDEGHDMEKVREGFPFSPEGLWEEEVRDRERRYFPLSSHTHPALIYPTTHTHTHTHTQLLGLTSSNIQKMKSTKDIKTL